MFRLSHFPQQFDVHKVLSSQNGQFFVSMGEKTAWKWSEIEPHWNLKDLWKGDKDWKGESCLVDCTGQMTAFQYWKTRSFSVCGKDPETMADAQEKRGRPLGISTNRLESPPGKSECFICNNCLLIKICFFFCCCCNEEFCTDQCHLSRYEGIILRSYGRNTSSETESNTSETKWTTWTNLFG
jgi:hypothetical protein